MAVTYDTAGTFAGNGGNGTFTLTVGSGSDRVMVVENAFWVNGGVAGPSNGAGSVTLNGVAMTFVPNSQSTRGQFLSEQWYYIAPPTGAGTVIIYGTTANTTQRSVAAVFAGADQTTPIDVTGTFSSDADPMAGTVTTTVDGVYLLDIISHASANNISVGSGQTQIFNRNDSGVTAGASYKQIVTAGVGTMSWVAPGGPSAYTISGIRPSSGGGGGATTINTRLALLGVGL